MALSSRPHTRSLLTLAFAGVVAMGLSGSGLADPWMAFVSDTGLFDTGSAATDDTGTAADPTDTAEPADPDGDDTGESGDVDGDDTGESGDTGGDDTGEPGDVDGDADGGADGDDDTNDKDDNEDHCDDDSDVDDDNDDDEIFLKPPYMSPVDPLGTRETPSFLHGPRRAHGGRRESMAHGCP